jgi:hypothetical protein
MADCSLCKDSLQPEGGTILFTDSRGIPFEVCGKCEENINVLHNSTDDAETGRALDYISACTENLETREVYNSLMSFVKQEEPGAILQDDDEDSSDELSGSEDDSEEAGEPEETETEEEDADGEPEGTEDDEEYAELQYDEEPEAAQESDTITGAVEDYPKTSRMKAPILIILLVVFVVIAFIFFKFPF